MRLLYGRYGVRSCGTGLKDDILGLILVYPAFSAVDDAYAGRALGGRFDPKDIPDEFSTKKPVVTLGRRFIEDARSLDDWMERIKALIAKTGGLKSLVGTDDNLQIKEMIEGGDKWAELIYRAFAYNLAKYIGSYACVLEGKVDAIIMTGGVSNDEDFIAGVEKYAGWIAPVKAYGGDFEMEALAAGAIRALKGEEELLEYTGEPVFRGFDFEP